jgi:uncharacterized membrane protein
MAENSYISGTGDELSSINFAGLMRALIPPLFIWGAMVVMATMGGQPGVVCITPLAWTLALWAGQRYSLRMLNHETSKLYLGSALLGLLLGIGFGLVFLAGLSQMAPDPTNTADVARTQGVAVYMFTGGLIVCPVLSVIMAAIVRRRYEAQMGL